MATNKKKETETDSAVDTATGKVSLLVIGACLINVGGVGYKHGEIVEIDESIINSQAIKHLIITKQVEFLNDYNRTREYISAVKVKARADEGKTREQLEKGLTY